MAHLRMDLFPVFYASDKGADDLFSTASDLKQQELQGNNNSSLNDRDVEIKVSPLAIVRNSAGHRSWRIEKTVTLLCSEKNVKDCAAEREDQLDGMLWVVSEGNILIQVCRIVWKKGRFTWYAIELSIIFTCLWLKMHRRPTRADGPWILKLYRNLLLELQANDSRYLFLMRQVNTTCTPGNSSTILQRGINDTNVRQMVPVLQNHINSTSNDMK